jgi:hypothetical protein
VGLTRRGQDSEPLRGPSARLSRRAFLAGSAAWVAACASTPEPPLAALYRGVGSDAPPLIVIPGAFGSLLRDGRSGRELWPGPGVHVLLSRYRELAVEFDEDTLDPLPGRIQAPAVLPRRLGMDFYGQLLRTLERFGGYRRCEPGTPPAGKRSYYVFTYDWRLDNTLAARALHELIEQVRRDHGDPRLPVDALAHSNGGLLVRYYARFGPQPMPDGDGGPALDSRATAFRRVLLLGTPNLGTLQPVLGCVRGEELLVQHMPQEVVATCSGGPQLMPHPALTWLANTRGETIARDVFALDTWRELGWCVFDPRVRERTIAAHGSGASGRRYLAALERYFARHLSRGRSFVRLLAQPGPPDDVRPFVFGGDCSPTLARLVVESVAGRIIVRETADAIAEPIPDVDYASLLFEPGDLVVTRSSLLGRLRGAPALPIEHAVFLCEEHRRLTANATFQNNLLHTLLSDSP